MTRLGTQSPPVPSRSRTARIWFVLTAGLVCALALVASSWVRGPSYVRQVTIVNPTAYQLEVDVGAPGANRVVGLGAIHREGSRTVEEVIDQGDQWVFRFSYGRQAAGELAAPRSQLEQDGWRITVPPEVGDRLGEAGIPPSP